MSSLITEMSIRSLYDYMYSKRKKERIDFILEPFQAMCQLACLSFCPKNTKLQINNNILSIQLPSITQGLTRYFNDDNKQDLYYLMNVFRRFFIYYSFMKNNEYLNDLYDILIKKASLGLDNLIDTYSCSDKVNVIQSLEMYKLLLEKPDFFIKNKIHKEDENIDNIFKNIVNIYTNEEFSIIKNILVLMELNYENENYKDYLNAINLIMHNKNRKIREWIDKNIIF